MKPYDATPTALLRFAFEVLFWAALWVVWGWGYGLIAIVVIASTGVLGDKRRVLVPVPGSSRILLELALSVAGLWAVYLWFGGIIGSIILLVHLVYLVMSLKRFRALTIVRHHT